MHPDPAPAVTATGLRVVRGTTPILHGLNFSLEPGSITGLLGPSGCGKTTLMRALVGVQRYEGYLQVLGHAPGEPATRGHIGYVTQAPSVYADLTVGANLAYFAALADATPRTARTTGKAHGRSARDAHSDLLARVGLQDYVHTKVGALSGGQRSRASLACALIGEPELLVLDEPTVGLDPLTRRDLWELFYELADDTGATLIVSSHVLDEAAHCDNLLFLREGRLLWDGAPQELLHHTGREDYESAFIAIVESDTSTGTSTGAGTESSAHNPEGDHV